MANWRPALGFDGEDLDFEMVHQRYRERMLTLGPAPELVDLQQLNWALEEARKELATQRRSAS